MSTPGASVALGMVGRSAALTLGHRAAIAAYMLFALFPLFWLIKIAVTPDRLLYTEGIRLWPSSTTFANFNFVLLQSDFPTFFANSVTVSLGTALAVTLVASAAGYAFSRFTFPGKYIVVFVLLLTQMFPLVMLIAPMYRLMTPLGLTEPRSRCPEHRRLASCRGQRACPTSASRRWSGHPGRRPDCPGPHWKAQW